MKDKTLQITPTLRLKVLKSNSASTEGVDVQFIDKSDNCIFGTVVQSQEHIQIKECDLELMTTITMLDLIRGNSRLIFYAVSDYLNERYEEEVRKKYGSNEDFMNFMNNR